jgi:cytoskeleton protein RodZ
MLDRTDAQPLTAGAWLRQQREAADISLEALSVALKVRPSRLQALESDQLSEMPDDLFVRSLALGICRHLKANEHALLPLLPQSPQRDLRVGRNQIHANPYNPNRWTGPMLFSPKRWSFKWFAGGVAMALSGLLWLVWPDAKVADLSSPLPVPVGATNTEAATGSPLPTLPAQVLAVETPLSPVAVSPTPASGIMPLESKSGKPHPLPENVVITPVTPMALKQNLSHLPAQTTKP